MPNFADIAQKKMDEIERPPLPPVGTYRWRIAKLPDVTKSQDEKWQFVRFFCKAVEPRDDVDLSDYSGDPANITLTKSFVFNLSDEVEFEKTEYAVRQFLEKHVQCVEPGVTLREAMNASVNAEFDGYVAWRADKRDESGETMNAEITRTAPVE